MLRVTVIAPAPGTGGIADYAERLVQGLSEGTVAAQRLVVADWRVALGLTAALARRRPDVVRVEYTISTYGVLSLPLLLGLWVYRWRWGTPLIASLHEPKREMQLLGGVGRCWYRVLGAGFDRLYVHTEEDRAHLINWAGVPAPKLAVIPLGTIGLPDPLAGGADSAALRRRYDLGDRRVILCFGYLHVDKGIEYLLEASRLLRDRAPGRRENWVVLIAGAVRRRHGWFRLMQRRDEAYARRLRRAHARARLDGLVRFVGAVDQADLKALFALAWLVVLPYTNTEQSGVLNLALGEGRPVLASRVGGLAELLAGTSALVPPRDSAALALRLEQLLDDPSAYQQLAQECAGVAEAHAPGVVAARVVADLADVHSRVCQRRGLSG
jgi:glycosyltransferase involved in cell wall biosynthesis